MVTVKGPVCRALRKGGLGCKKCTRQLTGRQAVVFLSELLGVVQQSLKNPWLPGLDVTGCSDRRYDPMPVVCYPPGFAFLFLPLPQKRKKNLLFFRCSS